MCNVDLRKYNEFVKCVTSDASNYNTDFIDRIYDLANDSVNVSLLMTAAIGLSAECGEFAEIPKKIIFQGKPYDDDAIHHMTRELGDIMWYWITACRALRIDPNEVIEENVKKLESRYPGGTFDISYSENRKIGDI